MWELVITYMLDGVAQKTERTYYPPLLGDEIEFEGFTAVVVKRVWKQHFMPNPILDIVIIKKAKGRTKK